MVVENEIRNIKEKSEHKTIKRNKIKDAEEVIGVERREVTFDSKDEVDEADEEEAGVERRLEDDEDDEGRLMNCDSCRQRSGGDRNKEQFRNSCHCWWCAVKTCLQVL